MERRTGQISALAHSQLEQWRIYARRWQVVTEYQVTPDNHPKGGGISQMHLVCAGLRHQFDQPMPWGPCGQTIQVIYDGDHFVMVDVETVESLIVAHIRNVHREIEEAVYNGS